MSESAENPIFVVGSPRSGTTLLRFILSSHPRLFIPAETGFVPYLGKYADASLSQSDVRSILERIGRLNRDWASMVADVPAFYESLPEPTLKYVLDGLYCKKSAPFGAERWGDKTPNYVLHIPMLAAIFPGAQFVHVVRDGRDATLSAQKKWAGHSWYMDSYYLLKNWARCVEQGRASGRRIDPSRYMEVRYESLVEQPALTVERMCAFLSEEFHPDMLDHTQLARKQIMPGGHVEVWEPVSQASVGRWKTQMPDFDQRLADRVAGSTLASSGYELAERGPLSGRERTRLTFQSTKFRFTDLGRRTLSALGLITMNRGKRKRR